MVGPTPRVLVRERRKGGSLRALSRWVFPLTIALAFVGALGGIGAYVHFSRDLPAIYDVDAYAPPGVTRFFARDGRLVGEFTTERRVVVPLADMPASLIQAFLAAEDQRFFEHEGVDVRGVLRAALANFRAGRVVEGASTITQQLCKTLVGKEQSLTRKVREALLARRLESRLSKLDILYLYLNQIYLGHGAYGVQAAAQAYFRKDVGRLSLSESAVLAGLPPKPSLLNPVRDFEGSKERQRWVLGRMATEGFITTAQADAAAKEPLQVFAEPQDVFADEVPDFVEHVRRYVQATYGYDALNRDALEVHLTVDVDLQRAAERSLKQGLSSLGERQGYVGPITYLDDGRAKAALDRLRGRSAAHVHAGPSVGSQVGPPDAAPPVSAMVPAIVRAVSRTRIDIEHAGGLGSITQGDLSWAAPWSAEDGRNERRQKDARTVVRPGDLVLVAPTRRPSEFRLAQVPPVQGALVSMELQTGAVVAMVGGWDYDQSEYNRAFQGCRQPGSAFKPIVYSRALDLDYTLATLVSDTPVSVFDVANQLLWKPKNFGGGFLGDVLLHRAFVNSMNVPAIKVLDYIGSETAVAWARHLGLTTPMYPDRSLVLGSSCVLPWDLLQVYAVFGQRGLRARPAFVSRITRRDGTVLEDRTHFADPWAPAGARLDGMLRTWGEPRERVVDERTAYLLQFALKGVVDSGTAVAAKRLGKVAGGKTGTTDAYDAWFVGFTESLVTGVWVGSDRNDRKLGDGETGGRAALPIWLEFMQEALAGRNQADFTSQPPVGIVFADIDLETGRLAATGRPSMQLPFKEGTIPVEAAPAAGTFGRADVDVIEGRF